MKIAQCLVEADDFDLLAMGRPEGPGCYCYANNVLKQAIQTIASNYAYVVIDNEAGLENLSRRIVTKVDLLVLVADPSKRGLDTLKRLYDLAREMDVQYGRLAIALNRLRRPELPAGLDEIRRHSNADHVLALPDDPDLATFDEAGRNLADLPADNAVVARVDTFLDQVEIWGLRLAAVACRTRLPKPGPRVQELQPARMYKAVSGCCSLQSRGPLTISADR